MGRKRLRRVKIEWDDLIAKVVVKELMVIWVEKMSQFKGDGL